MAINKPFDYNAEKDAGFSVNGVRFAEWDNATGKVKLTGQVDVDSTLVFSDGESIDDNNGNELLEFGVTASAVNQLKVANAATTGNVALTVVGSDTAVGGLAITSKAAGAATVAGGAVTITGGLGNTTGTGGALTVSAGAGGNNAAGGATAVNGGAAGGGNNAGGQCAVSGGAGSGSGAGGDAAILGGSAGATGSGGRAFVFGSAGGSTSGAGGDAGISGGDAVNGNSNGGNVVISGGPKAGSGYDGVIFNRSLQFLAQGAPAAKTVSATLTAAELKTQIITVNQGAGATSAQQLPTAADLDTALPSAAAGDAFDFSVINISTVAAEDASITTNAGWTLAGNMVVASNAADTDKSSGLFRARKTGAAAWTLYRRA